MNQVKINKINQLGFRLFSFKNIFGLLFSSVYILELKNEIQRKKREKKDTIRKEKEKKTSIDRVAVNEIFHDAKIQR